MTKLKVGSSGLEKLITPNNIRHVFTAPRYPFTIGQAEMFVKVYTRYLTNLQMKI